MKIQDWHNKTKAQQKILITQAGKGLNYKGVIDSLPYFNAAIAHITHVKQVEQLPRYSVKATAEHLRWRTTSADGDLLFKVNNNLSADINHLLLRLFPELNGFMTARSKGVKV